MLQELALFGITCSQTYTCPPLYLGFDEIQFAAWCIGAELQTDLTFWELINWLVGWILHKESGARWTVPIFKFYMCTGVVNVSSTAWLGNGIHLNVGWKNHKFESNVSKTIEILFTWMLNLNTNSHVHIL